jgi:hypothetical protein
MRYVRYFGLGLMAAFALGAFAASSASAGELLALIAPKGGSAAGVSFLSLGGLSLLTTDKPGLQLVHCKEVHDHGLFLTSTLGDILIFFLGCKTKVLLETPECSSPGAPAGDIHLPLETTLFHLGLAHLTLATGRIPAVAILLIKHVLFTCGSLVHALVLGAVIGALTLDAEGSQFQKPIPLGVPFSTALLNFEQTAHGLQHLRLFLLPGSGLVSYDLDTSINSAAAELSAEVSLDLLDLFSNNTGKVELELVEHP